MWKIASEKKSVLPKLYNYLRNALNGAVAVGYPSLIVLLAYLPEEVRILICIIKPKLSDNKFGFSFAAPNRSIRISFPISGRVYLQNILIDLMRIYF